MLTDRGRTRLALTITAAMAAAIGWLTLQPLPFAGPPGGDKTHHLVAFAALVLPAAVLRPRWLLPLLGFALVFGGLIEVVQPHVGRTGEVGDFLADAAGAVIGVFAGAALGRRLDRRSPAPSAAGPSRS